ncbi:MAG: DUF2730 family protein [Sulfuricellaceae bacterium]|nr:DUF2730 family protein [Sulfuricellaceae bacterium]
MDYMAADFWWKTAITVINMGIGAYLFWERHNDVTQRRIDTLETDLDGRMDNHAMRLSRVESRIEMLPSHEDLSDLHERINEVSKAVHTLSGEMSGIKTTLGLIHQHLLNGGKQ